MAKAVCTSHAFTSTHLVHQPPMDKFPPKSMHLSICLVTILVSIKIGSYLHIPRSSQLTG